MHSTVRLFGYWRSSSTYRVRIALALAGISYESVKIDLLAGEQVGAENLARNPLGLVPTLEIDGHALYQSLAIVEYLDETRGLSLLPDDPSLKAYVRSLSMAIAMEIAPVCNQRVAKFANEKSNGQIATADWMKHFITLGLAGFEGMLANGSTGPYCAGNRITLADICLVPQIYNAVRWGVDVSAFPVANAINGRLEALDAFRAAHPDVANAARS